MQKNIHQEDLSVHFWMFSCPQMVQQKPPPQTFTQSLTPSSLYSCLLAYWRDNGCKLMKPLRALVTQGRVGTQTLRHPQTLINQACSLPKGCPTQTQCVCVWFRPRLPPIPPHFSNLSAGFWEFITSSWTLFNQGIWRNHHQSLVCFVTCLENWNPITKKTLTFKGRRPSY